MDTLRRLLQQPHPLAVLERPVRVSSFICALSFAPAATMAACEATIACCAIQCTRCGLARASVDDFYIDPHFATSNGSSGDKTLEPPFHSSFFVSFFQAVR